MRGRVAVLIAAIFAVLLPITQAAAQDLTRLDAALARLSADAFPETEAAIREIAASDAPTGAERGTLAVREIGVDEVVLTVSRHDGTSQTTGTINAIAATISTT